MVEGWLCTSMLQCQKGKRQAGMKITGMVGGIGRVRKGESIVAEALVVRNAAVAGTCMGCSEVTMTEET